MIFETAGVNVSIIGDVHLGKAFKTGVPLHRRGERERLVKEQFQRELLQAEGDVIVQMGDIFDRFRVELDDVLWAADVLAAVAKPVIVLAGNHDLSRNLERSSSFDLLARLCRGNVLFVKDRPLVAHNLLFVPWSPVVSAEEMLSGVAGRYAAAFGHWDHVAVGDQSNLVPIDRLSKLTSLVFSGHDHVMREYTVGHLHVAVTGSMQPYGFDQDPRETVYVTRTLAEVEGNPDAFTDKCLRVLLQDGEGLPTDIECLQLVAKRVGATDTDDIEVGFEDGLNVDALFNEVMVDVDPAIVGEVRAKYLEA